MMGRCKTCGEELNANEYTFCYECKDKPTEEYRRLTAEEVKKLPWITWKQIGTGILIIAFLYFMAAITDQL
jgi:hypothetical protein